MAGKLTAIAEEAAASRSLNGEWKLSTLLKLCSEFERRDRQVESRKSTAKKIVIGGYAALFLCAAGLFILMVMEEFVSMLWVLPLIGCSIGAAVWGGRLRKRLFAVDFADELRLTIVPLLRKVSSDLDHKKKIHVRLDLRTIDPDKEDRELPPTGSGSKRGTTTRLLFSEPLGSLRLPLANGSTLVLSLRNQFRRSIRHYRSSSGKSKRKEKWKKSTKVTTLLIPHKPTAQWKANAMRSFTDPVRGSLSFKAVKGITAAKLCLRAKFPGADLPTEVISAKEVLSMLVRLSAMAHQGIQGAESGR